MVVLRIGLGLWTAFVFGIAFEASAETGSGADEAAAWSEGMDEVLEVVRLEGDVERGREIYAVCAECHLAGGAGQPDGTMPQLAGQHRSVLIKQMVDIRSGLRHNPLMYPYVARLDDPQDLADLATYIAGLPVPSDNGTGPGTDLERGKALYEASCARCHGSKGEGSAEAIYPRLEGQHYRYLVRQLIDIAGGRRGNANPEMVAAIADFSARDVAIVADYISRLETADAEARN
jgi:cytochrome c553